MTHSLQWQFRVNELVAAAPAAATWPPSYTANALSQAQMFHIKESMKGSGSWTDAEGAATTPTNNWLVLGSSDSVAAGNNDGVDRWASASNIVSGAGASPKSWIVLAQPGISTNFEICISMSSGQLYNPLIVMSPNKRFGAVGGGADGTNTARPTALDEIVVSNSADCGVMTVIGGSCRIHVLKSSTGSSTRILITRNSNPCGFLAFEKPVIAPAGFDHPAVCLVSGTSTTNQTSPFITQGVIYNAAGGGNWKGRNRDYPNGAAFVAQAMTDSGWLFAVDDIPVGNEFDGAVQYYHNKLVATGNVPGTRGAYGSLSDFYYASEGFQPGTVSPDGDWLIGWPMVLPWNKSVPLFY